MKNNLNLVIYPAITLILCLAFLGIVFFYLSPHFAELYGNLPDNIDLTRLTVDIDNFFDSRI